VYNTDEMLDMKDGKHGKGYCCDMRTLCPWKYSFARNSLPMQDGSPEGLYSREGDA
jgi:hypothetical protein